MSVAGDTQANDVARLTSSQLPLTPQSEPPGSWGGFWLESRAGLELALLSLQRDAVTTSHVLSIAVMPTAPWLDDK